VFALVGKGYQQLHVAGAFFRRFVISGPQHSLFERRFARSRIIGRKTSSGRISSRNFGARHGALFHLKASVLARHEACDRYVVPQGYANV
jgi:hypothetical protein